MTASSAETKRARMASGPFPMSVLFAGSASADDAAKNRSADRRKQAGLAGLLHNMRLRLGLHDHLLVRLRLRLRLLNDHLLARLRLRLLLLDDHLLARLGLRLAVDRTGLLRLRLDIGLLARREAVALA